MSLFDPELGAKITTAASQHVDGMVTDMYTVVEYMAPDGEQMVVFATAPDQKATTSAGLLTLAESISEFELRAYVGSMYGGGEPER